MFNHNLGDFETIITFGFESESLIVSENSSTVHTKNDLEFSEVQLITYPVDNF